MEKQLAELQMLMMDLQRSMESLSDQIISHEKRFSENELRMRKLEMMIMQLAEPGADGGFLDEKPPHY